MAIPTPSAERQEPVYIDDVLVDGTSYFLDNIKHDDLSGATTFLFAMNAQNEELWRLAVYTTTFDSKLETDVQEVYPISLDYNQDTHSFVIENESHVHYTIDLKTRKVLSN